ncbi:NAD(P)/FAD-dependent oxidoreductase [Brachybacterium sp.]|uniref:NAD(P)/FAD-dependent oxidoreductase n=1 Tax=Brachybacterium sp. TaxID=1891286 RepID=UPI002ED12267
MTPADTISPSYDSTNQGSADQGSTRRDSAGQVPIGQPATDALPAALVDVAVIGGGAAGLNGALMLARSRRSVVVIDSGTPRNAPAEGIHGLLGNEGTPPAAFLARGRAELRQYGGLIVTAEVASARAADPSAEGDLRFEVALADGRTLTARRLLITTGTRDELPAIPGLAQHWGHGLVHCPFCHGWEVRDQAIGVLATRPASFHHALMFAALSDDLTVFTIDGLEVDPGTRERFDALGVRVIEGGVQEIVASADGGIAGVRMADGELVPREVLVAATVLHPRLDGLEELGLAVEELSGGMGWKVAADPSGGTEIPGVSVAGNVTDPAAQVGLSAAAGALAGARLHGMLVMTDADAAVTRRAHATA